MKEFPGNYDWLMSEFRNVMDRHQDLGKALREAGPLDARQAHLVQLAAAAASRSEGAVHSHVKRALNAGAAPAEIYHALLLCMSTIGFPNMAAGLSWAREVIEG